MFPIPEHLDYEVDTEKWGKFKISDKSNHVEKNLNGYIALRIQAYQKIFNRTTGKQFRDILQEDFEGWTDAIFTLADAHARRHLRWEISAHKVSVNRKGNQTYASLLKDIVEDEGDVVWTDKDEDELRKLIEGQPIYCREIPKITIPPIKKGPLVPQDDAFKAYQKGAGPSGGDVTIGDGGKMSFGSHDEATHDPSAPDGGILGLQSLEQPMEPLSNDESKKISDFLKVFWDSKKYTGDVFDILYYRLQVFQSTCNTLGIGPDLYLRLFPNILKGRAMEYYHSVLAGKGYDLKELVMALMNHFETEERKQFYLREWNTTTLAKTIEKNPEKTKLECFEIMIDYFLKLHNGLAKEYQYEHTIRDQVLNACRSTPECNYATANPAHSFEGVLAGIRASIGVAQDQRLAPPHSQFPAEDQGPDYSEHNYQDRTYGGNSTMMRYNGGGRGGGGNSGQYRGGYKGSFRSNGGGGYRGNQGSGGSNGGSKNTGSRTGKTCNICAKPTCWSTKHTPEERQRYYEKFVRNTQHFCDYTPDVVEYNTYLAETEGVEGVDEMATQFSNDLNLGDGSTSD